MWQSFKKRVWNEYGTACVQSALALGQKQYQNKYTVSHNCFYFFLPFSVCFYVVEILPNACINFLINTYKKNMSSYERNASNICCVLKQAHGIYHSSMIVLPYTRIPARPQRRSSINLLGSDHQCNVLVHVLWCPHVELYYGQTG